MLLDNKHLISNEDMLLPTGKSNSPDQQEHAGHLQGQADQRGQGGEHTALSTGKDFNLTCSCRLLAIQRVPY